MTDEKRPWQELSGAERVLRVLEGVDPVNEARIMDRVDLEPISAFLGPATNLNPMRASEIRKYGDTAVTQWCVTHAVYQIPTTRLIAWLHNEIGERKAIEIGAGNGSIGRALNITRTDSGIQTTPEMQRIYKMIGQATTESPPDVERLEASEAVAKYEPEVVIGCWVTQRFDASKGDVEEEAQASVGGIDEEWILDQPCVQKYIVVGNMGSHDRKRILGRPHREKRAPWLVSRAFTQADNRIWVWER